MKPSMKQFLILICVVLLSACQPFAASSFTSTPTKISVSPIPSASSTFTPTLIKTSVPTETFTPQPTQFFKPINVPTLTPSSPAQCPKEITSLEFDVQKATANNNNLNQDQEHEQLIKNIVGYLNSGGTLQSVPNGFAKKYGRSFDKEFYIADVTGDNVSELIIPYGIWFDVIGCSNNAYKLMFTDTYDSDLSGVDILDITDINKDSVAEIIVYFNGCFSNRCPTIRVYEWNGKEYENLNADSDSTNGCGGLKVAPFKVEVRDIDENRTKEIILTNTGRVFPDIDFPYRKETRICMWNGQNIVLYKVEFDAPYYRFQAVQDGDRATLSGDFDKALNFYQQAIKDKNLEWFTQERKMHDFWVYHSKIFSTGPTPTASPGLAPDPNEYPTLAAYSYYRIMLLYILKNDDANAKMVFDKLQSKFPSESSGGYFTNVASAFWQEYKSTLNIQISCGKIIDYVKEHPLPIEYLGDSVHGTHSINYTPEAICPFK